MTRSPLVRGSLLTASLVLPVIAAAQVTVSTPARASFLAAEITEEWASNARFVGADGPSDLAHRLSLAGGHTFAGARGRFTLVGRGAILRYTSLRDLDRRLHDLRVGGDYSLGRRTDVSASVATGVALTGDLPAAGEERAVAGHAVARTKEVGANTVVRLSQRRTLQVRAARMAMSFDTPRLATRQSIGGQIALAEALTRRIGAGTVYAFEHDVLGDGRALDGHSLHATIGHDTERVETRLAAGATLPILRGASGSNRPLLHPYGTGSLEIAARLANSVATVGYHRAAGHRFGESTVVRTDAAVARVSRRLRRGFSMEASGHRTWSIGTPDSAGALRHDGGQERLVTSRTEGLLAWSAREGGTSVRLRGFWRSYTYGSHVASRGFALSVGHVWARGPRVSRVSTPGDDR